MNMNTKGIKQGPIDALLIDDPIDAILMLHIDAILLRQAGGHLFIPIVHMLQICVFSSRPSSPPHIF